MLDKTQINNTELFEFEFVDRENERKILKDFLDDCKDRILWVYGESGVGKSFFVEQILKTVNDFTPIHIKNSKNNTDGTCIISLIEKLQEIVNQNFYSFVRQYYQGIQAFASDLAAITKISITKSDFLKYILSKNFFLVGNNKEYDDLASVLNKYIGKLPIGKKIVIVIDNLHYCDENSFHVLLNFVKCCINNSRCRFIFISTESIEENSSYERQLSEELPYNDIHIPKIPSEEYFINMLPSKQFDIENLTKEDIKKIYSFCKGLPEKFKDLLHNLHKKHFIDYRDSKMILNRKDMLKYMVSQTNNNLDLSQYSSAEKCIILTIICMGVPVRVDLLIQLSKVCYESFFILTIDDAECKQAIRTLQPKPLKTIIENGKAYFYTDHDLTFNAALLFFEENNMYSMACSYFYDYLNKTTVNEFIECFEENERKELFANLSYYAEHINWIDENFSCGSTFFNNYNYIQAFKYLSRLISLKKYLQDEQLLKIGIAAYEVGNYQQAFDILNTISEENILSIYNYCIYMGKSANMTINEELAIQFFEKAIVAANGNVNDEIYAKYMKYLVLLQIPAHLNDAKQLYEGLVKNIVIAYEKKQEKNLYLPSNAKLLKSCYDFYFNDEAIYLFKIAEEIADYCHDTLEKAAILHNEGFEYIRQNQIDTGKSLFEQARQILENTKRHDSAYCINNIAICKMFSGDYADAIDDLRKALLYQRSYYLELTVNTMLMQCYRIVGDSKYISLKEKMIEIINGAKFKDPAIIRKICMNLAICEYYDENYLASRKYLTQAWIYIKNTSSEFRAYQLYNKVNNDQLITDGSYLFNQSMYFNDLNFEPWFITLSHD